MKLGKVIEVGSYVAFAAATLIYAVDINSRSGFRMGSDLGHAFYPNLLTGAMLLLCSAGLVRSIRTRPEITFPSGAWKVASLIIATCIFILSWRLIGQFYIISFIYVFGLTFIFLDSNKTLLRIIWSTLCALIALILVYIIFDIAAGVTW